MARIVCISDTHLRHRRLRIPPCDLLIHAGDASNRGTQPELEAFMDWMERCPARSKVLIAGNHDVWCEREPQAMRAAAEQRGITYLCDEGTIIDELDGLHIWGSPVTPRFHNMAFNRDRGAPIRAHWDAIPQTVDVLVTHGPPHGTGDRTILRSSVGCDDLRETVTRIKPRLHVFGHIHEAAGVYSSSPNTTFVNAASVSLTRLRVRAPVVLELDARRLTAGRPDPESPA